MIVAVKVGRSFVSGRDSKRCVLSQNGTPAASAKAKLSGNAIS